MTLTNDRLGQIALGNAHMYARTAWACWNNGNAPESSRRVNLDHFAKEAEVFYRRAYWFRLTGRVYAGLGLRTVDELSLEDLLILGCMTERLRPAIIKYLALYECRSLHTFLRVSMVINIWPKTPALEDAFRFFAREFNAFNREELRQWTEPVLDIT